MLLYVGGIAPHKNLANLLRGFAIAAPDADDLFLAICGDPAGDGFHSNYEETVALAASDPRLNGKTHFTGFIADEDLPALYSDALALVLPVFRRFRIAGAGSNRLRHSGPDGGGRRRRGGRRECRPDFRSVRAQAIADCILRLLSEPQTHAELSRAAPEAARRHGWDRAGQLALGALERIGQVADALLMVTTYHPHTISAAVQPTSVRFLARW